MGWLTYGVHATLNLSKRRNRPHPGVYVPSGPAHSSDKWGALWAVLLFAASGAIILFATGLPHITVNKTPETTRNFDYVLYVIYAIVGIGILWLLAQFRPSKAIVQPTPTEAPPTPVQPNGPLGFPLGPNGPRNPRMYYSNRR